MFICPSVWRKNFSAGPLRQHGKRWQSSVLCKQRTSTMHNSESFSGLTHSKKHTGETCFMDSWCKTLANGIILWVVHTETSWVRHWNSRPFHTSLRCTSVQLLKESPATCFLCKCRFLHFVPFCGIHLFSWFRSAVMLYPQDGYCLHLPFPIASTCFQLHPLVDFLVTSHQRYQIWISLPFCSCKAGRLLPSRR